jgi:Flp pilus assembly protein TadB
MTHVSTQFPYAVFVAVVSAICFLIAGLVQNAYVPLLVGVALIIGGLFVMRMIVKGKETAPASE